MKKRKLIITGIAAVAIIILITAVIINQQSKQTTKGSGISLSKEGIKEDIKKDDKRKQVLNVYMDDLTGIFNPAFAQTTGDKAVSSVIFEPLMKKDKTGKYVPVLAKTINISEDGKEFTITLKNKINFSDGEPVKAQDVCASIAALCLSQIDENKSKMYWNIVGIEEFISNPISLPEGIQVVDDKTAKIKFMSASVDNLNLLETQIQKGTFLTNIKEGKFLSDLSDIARGGVGSGAYTINAGYENSRVLLETNENFRRKIHDIKQILFMQVGSYEVSEELKKGNVDMVLFNSDNQLYDSFYEASQYDVYEIPSNQLYYLGFNFDNPVLQNLNVRQAISTAINKSTLIQSDKVKYFFHTKGIGFEDSAVYGDNILHYNRKRSVELLKEESEILKKYPDSLRLPVVKTNEIQMEFAKNIAKDLGEVGIGVEIMELNEGDYLDVMYMKHDFDIYLSSADIGSTVASYQSLVEDRDSLPVGCNDKELQEAILSMTKAITMEDELKARKETNTTINETVPIVSLGYKKRLLSASADLSGFEVTPYSSFIDNLYRIRVN